MLVVLYECIIIELPKVGGAIAPPVPLPLLLIIKLKASACAQTVLCTIKPKKYFILIFNSSL